MSSHRCYLLLIIDDIISACFWRTAKFKFSMIPELFQKTFQCPSRNIYLILNLTDIPARINFYKIQNFHYSATYSATYSAIYLTVHRI